MCGVDSSEWDSEYFLSHWAVSPKVFQGGTTTGQTEAFDVSFISSINVEVALG
jgi:hypothetical protein